VVPEELGQSDYVGEHFANGHPILVNASGIRPQPAEHRRPAGVAERKLAVRMFESNAPGSQFVHVRRFDQRMIVAAQATVQIIDGDE
jgi:hypothetical protein